MTAILAIAKRELMAYFVSGTAYVLLTAWLVLSGFEFYLLASVYAQSHSWTGGINPMSAFFGSNSILLFIRLLAFVPVFTMRLLAEEWRRGTMQPLMTVPISESSIVLGKYLAGLAIWATLWIPTLLYVWITSQYGDVDMGAVLASYIGVFFLGLYYVAIGTLMSAIARTQIIAAVLSFMVFAGLFLFGLAEYLFYDSPLKPVFAYVSVWNQMATFAKGIVDSRAVVFSTSLTAVALFLSVRVLEGRRLTG